MYTVRPNDPTMKGELFIRYAEASALMPSLQFSYFPWNYGEHTKKAVLNCAMLHKALEPYVRELCKDTTAPIIRPIWYSNESNSELYTVKGEFMLGNDLLAAPILDSGIKEKTVVLPSGTWLDIYSGNEIEGEITVAVKCPMIPIYIRKGNEKLYNAVSAVMKGYTDSTILPDEVTATYKAGVDRSTAKTG